MSEKDLEVLITLDDPGEDELEEDRFHHLEAENETWPNKPEGSTTGGAS